MGIADILAKIQKGELSLTEEEKEFLKNFDLQKTLDDNAASARRKALDEAKTARARVAELESQLQSLQDTADKDGLESASKLSKLEKMVEKLTSDYEHEKAEKAALVRSQGIAGIMSANSIRAARGIADKGLLRLFEDAIGETALDDADAVKAVVEQFKKDYGGMIAVEGVKVPASGNPATSMFSSANNPFKTGNVTEQSSLLLNSPEQARALAAEAGVTLKL